MSSHLPARPNLEHLRKQAKEKLRSLQQRTPSSKLADAQHALALEYGFVNWSSLKAHVAAQVRRSPFAGTWTIDRSKSRRIDDSLQHAALRFDVVDDTVTITDVLVDAGRREARGTNTIVADGAVDQVSVFNRGARQHGDPI